MLLKNQERFQQVNFDGKTCIKRVTRWRVDGLPATRLVRKRDERKEIKQRGQQRCLNSRAASEKRDLINERD